MTKLFIEFHQSENPKDIPHFSNDQLNKSTSTDHFWSIDRGGYNWLKLPVKTAPGFDHPTLLKVLVMCVWIPAAQLYVYRRQKLSV